MSCADFASIILNTKDKGANSVDGSNVFRCQILPQVLEVVFVNRHGTGTESVNTQCKGVGVKLTKI